MLNKLKPKLIFFGSTILAIHGWLMVFRAPRTIHILYQVLLGRSGDGIWAFSSVDAGFRNWYQKIASDYRTQGRFGFAWDDGLGMALGSRIYNNWATYALLDSLGTRNMAGLSLVFFTAVSGCIVYFHFGLPFTCLFILLALVSPLFVGLHTHIWKAEFFWWGFGVLFCYLSLTNQGFLTGLLWSAIAVVNLPASVMLALFTAPVLIFLSLSKGTFLLLALGVLPGLVKHAVRFYFMWKSGFLALLVSEQSRLWKRPVYPVGSEIAVWIPFLIAVMADSSLHGNLIIAIIVAVTCIFLYWANFRFIYFNDVESFHLGFWALGLSMACVNYSWVGLIGILLFAYTNPTLFGFPLSGSCINSEDRLLRRAQETILHFKNYPSIKAIAYPLPECLRTFFELIPDGTRFLVESDGDPRSQSLFRVFWVWSEGYLPSHKIDLANEMYTRMNEPDLVDNILSQFNAKGMEPREMLETSIKLGARYVVAFTDESVVALSAAGYVERGVVDLSVLHEFRRIIPCPPVKLRLLEAPLDVGIISPKVEWIRKGNELVWQAESGKAYNVLYRYHPQFMARQGGVKLSVEYYSPFSKAKLRFMRVTAVRDGPITLRYESRFMGGMYDLNH